MTLSPGCKIRNYEILDLLGAGGMGEVYRAKDIRLGREVAIKILPHSLAADRERLDRFEREGRVLASFSQTNIAQIYGVEESGGALALVMELITGSCVSGPLPLKAAVLYARQIAEALEAAHEKGIIHRDLKPANIMVTPDGVIKVLDFGLASLVSHEAGADPANSATLTMAATRPGTVLGTTAYMSPEQATGRPVDRRTDIWAFGLVFWEMLTGRRLFTGATTTEILSKVMLADIDFDSLPAQTPVAIRELLRRCLERDVKNRLRDIGEARYVLSRPLESPAEKAVSSVAPQRHTWGIWMIFAGLALLIAGLGMFRLASRPESSAAHRFLPFATEAYGESKPFWSPDGRAIAYVATIDGKDQILTRALSAASPVQIANCPAICDVVGWSGDRSRVYYQSRTMHLDARIWSAAISGGAPARTFSDDFAVLASSVSPDGKRLAMLKVFVNKRGEQKAGLFISEPPGVNPVRVETFPDLVLVQPTWIAWFADSDRLIVYASGKSSTMFLVSVSQRTVRTVARKLPLLFGLSWSQDPDFAVAALRSAEAGASGLYWVDLRNGSLIPLRLFELPVDGIGVSPNGHSLAYTITSTDRDLVEIPLDGSPVRPLLATRLNEDSARYSPLADEFAYVTHKQIRIRESRSNAERVIVSAADFPNAVVPDDFRLPAFSPDGRRIAYNLQFKIYISPVNGGEPVALNSQDGEFGAEWSPDGVWIAYNWAKPRGSGLMKQRVGSSEPPVRLTNELCGAGPAWSPDGAWIACSLNGGEISLVPSGDGSLKRIGSGYEPHVVWSRDSNHLYVIRDSAGTRELGSLAWRTGAFKPLNKLPADLVIFGSGSYAGRMSLSYAGDALVATAERATGDIWIMDGLRTPEPWWKRMLARHSR